MASVCDRRRHQQQQQLLHHKTIFLPLFCRLSLKDISLPRLHRRDPSSSDHPSSPKVSCMGQLKRNNRIVTAATPPHSRAYSKLRKLFSGKTLLPTTTAAACIAAAGRSEICASRKESEVRSKAVDVGELDPPLPVVKKAAAGEEANVNLWKRRLNRAAPLETLQIRKSDTVSLPPTV
ncbi:hypothetical protein AAHA92_04024 [Salvia divinorum]|uniref:Uncharacterized protein n=1 Tax=Salvia divinorum TaxID=28513 RepID=A0ABD1HXX5_SALDI